jgi:pimeloyl-ACP methyl ester carboxylesterase
VDVTVMLVAGSLDQKFTGLAHELTRTLPRGAFAAVGGVGHAAHFEAPEAFNSEVLRYLQRVYSSGLGQS